VVADDFAHTRVKNLRAPAWQGIHACVLHFQQRVADRELRNARVIANLDHRKRFQVHLREALLQAADQVEVIFERQVGMKSADDVKLRGALGNTLRRPLINFIERICVRAWRIRRAAKRAQLAVRHADVRRIDVPVDVEVADVAVLFFADVVRQPAHRQQVVRLIEREAVFGGQAFAGQYSLRNGFEPRVRGLEGCRHLRCSQGRITTAAAPQKNRNNKLI
jgi:hypothetical protein